ncbi:MAG: YncE family protein [Thermoplasmata archaeon]|nr:YncE family protein [Thermoplasmata archaeon]
MSHPSAGIGTVLGTLDLTTNRLFAGAVAPSVPNTPDAALYDAQNGRLYVRGALGNDLSVVDPATQQDIANIPVPISQQLYVQVPSIALDTLSGQLYVTNVNAGNVSIVNTTTNAVVGSLFVGGSPYGIVFDPSNGEFYVANSGGSNVTVVNAATDRTVANLPAGTGPSAILYDARNSEMFVANYRSSNVTVINTTSNHVVASVPVGSYPIGLVLDTRDDYVDVLNEGGAAGNVTVLNPSTNTAVTSVPVGAAPAAALFVAANDRLYVANGGSNNVTVIDQATNTALVSVPTGHGASPYSLAYDPHTLQVYVACTSGQNVTVFNTSTDRTVANLSSPNFPVVALYDPAMDTVDIVNSGSYLLTSNVTVLDGQTHRSVGSIPLEVRPTGIAFDSGDGQLYVTDNAGNLTSWIDPSTSRVAGAASVGPWPTVLATPIVYATTSHRLFVINPSGNSVLVFDASRHLLNTIPVGLSPVGLAYDSVNNFVYVAQDLDGNVSVINAATDTVVGALTVALYQNLRAVGVDPATNEVYVADYGANNVTVFGATNFTKLATIPVGANPTAVVYDPLNRTILVGNYGSSNVSVISGTTLRGVGSFTLYDPGAMVYDPATNALYNAEGFSTFVDAVNASTYQPLAGSPLRLGPFYYTTGIEYDPTNQQLYVTQANGDSVSIIGTSSTFPVTFTESGLPNPTRWSVQFAGVTNASIAVSLGFRVPNGSYGFTVGGIAGYTANVTSGSVAVTGAPRSVEIGFSPNATGPSFYPVTFTETGLPASHAWYVTLGGSLRGGMTTSIAFTEPNGSYPFTVEIVPGFTASPGSGSALVQGRAVGEPIAFSANASVFSVSLQAAPSSVVLGASTTLTATPSGGTAPFDFVYTNLPTGCSTANQPTLSCSPSVTGAFTVGVTATDAVGHRANASAGFTVTPVPVGPGTKASSGTTSYVWWIVLVVILAVVALFLFLWSRRRKGADPTRAPTSGTPAPPGGAPPTS